MEKITPKTVLITGGNSGIGQAAAAALSQKGCTVYEISRRDSNRPPVRHIGADVTREESVAKAVDEILMREGKIDIVINCAGYGISGAIEFTDVKNAKAQFDVNFFGMVLVNKLVLPHMRKAGSGRILNISSVAAAAHIPFQAYYSATKAAMNSYSFALANEVRPYGISVAAIMPGDICTGFTDAREKLHAGDEEYDGRIGRNIRKMEKDEQNGMSAAKAGDYIAKIALKRKIKPLYTIGFSYQLLYLLIKFLPCRVRNYIVGILYA